MSVDGGAGVGVASGTSGCDVVVEANVDGAVVATSVGFDARDVLVTESLDATVVRSKPVTSGKTLLLVTTDATGLDVATGGFDVVVEPVGLVGRIGIVGVIGVIGITGMLAALGAVTVTVTITVGEACAGTVTTMTCGAGAGPGTTTVRTTGGNDAPGSEGGTNASDDGNVDELIASTAVAATETGTAGAGELRLRLEMIADPMIANAVIIDATIGTTVASVKSLGRVVG